MNTKYYICRNWAMGLLMLLASLPMTVMAQTERFEMVVEKTDGTELVFLITEDYPLLQYNYGGEEGVNTLEIQTLTGQASIPCPDIKRLFTREATTEPIKFVSGSWICYVAKKDLALTTGLTAYVITSLEASSAIASEINYIPQGVPVLLKREGTTSDFEVFPGIGTAPTVNLLKVYEKDKAVANREGYILYKDEFVLVNEGTLPAGKVFLPANGSGASTRSIVIGGEGTTSLNKVNSEEAKSEQWYDIPGRKFSERPIKKGVYILNGRKVVVK